MTQPSATGSRSQDLLRRVNVPFIGSLAVVIGSYVVALMGLRLVIDDNEVAATLSAMVIGAGPRVQRELEQRIPRTATPLVTFDGYRIRWWLLLICGAFAIWAAEATRIVIGFRGGPAMDVSASARDALTLLPVVAAVVIGVLAGARSDRWPVAVAILAIVLGHLASIATSDRVVEFATGAAAPGVLCAPDVSAPGDDDVPSGAPPGAVEPGPCPTPPPDPVASLFGTSAAARLLADELPLLILAGMAALWWGSRMRYAFFLGHVAGSLGDVDRAALVAIATDERRRRLD